jgi:hypothetical protein
MAEYRKEGTYEKPITTFNGIAMLLLLIALIPVLIFTIAVLRNPVFIVAVAVTMAFIAPASSCCSPTRRPW